MLIVAFVNFKGGSGKTTLAHHFAVAGSEEGLRVLAVDTDEQADLYRRLASLRDHPEDRPPVKWAPGCLGLYSPGEWVLPQPSFDLVVVDSAPKRGLPSGPIPHVVVVPIDGWDAGLNANDTVARALDAGVRLVILVRNGTAEGGRKFVREFAHLGDGGQVVVCDVDVPRAASIKRSAYTCKAAWRDPFKEAGSKRILAACRWLLHRSQEAA